MVDFIAVFFVYLFFFLVSKVISVNIIYAVHCRIKHLKLKYRYNLFLADCLSEVIAIAVEVVVCVIYQTLLKKDFANEVILGSGIYVAWYGIAAYIAASILLSLRVFRKYDKEDETTFKERLPVSIINAVVSAPYYFLLMIVPVAYSAGYMLSYIE